MYRLIFFTMMILTTNISLSKPIQIANIPGQDSNMDINDMLERIMQPYHLEVTNLNNSYRDKEIEQKLWFEFKKTVSKFEQINKYIFGHESPFRTLTTMNSHPELIDVSIEKNSSPATYSIVIKQRAKGHSFASRPFGINDKIPGGNFFISLENENYPINFAGGTMKDFANILQNEVSDKIDIKVISSSSDSNILKISGKKEGSDQIISFHEDISPLTEIELLTKGKEIKENIPWNTEIKIIGQDSYLTKELDFLIETNSFLSFEVMLEDMIAKTEDEVIENTRLSEVPISEVGALTNELFILPGALPILEDQIKEEDLNTRESGDAKKVISLHFDDESKEEFILSMQKYDISLQKHIGKTLKKIDIIAEKTKLATSEDITLTTIPDGIMKPYTEISKPQDAVLIVDGLTITRPTNTISDLIYGVTLKLLEESDQNITVTIAADTKLVKDTIIEWMIAYNEIMQEIYTFTTLPIKKIGRLKPLHKREKDGDDLKEGTFYGNMSLASYKNQLRSMVSSVHSNITDHISLLDQIGIYVSRPRSFNNDPDALRKGTLTLDTGELDNALNTKFQEVQDLFIYDSDNDHIADMGVAVSSIKINLQMLGGNGYLTKLEQSDGIKMKNLVEKIKKKEEEIEKTEIKERQALLKMNQAISESKALSESLKQRIDK